MLVYRDSELIVEFHLNGKSLRIHISESDEDFFQIFESLGEALGFASNSLSRLGVEEINGKDARKSVYLEI